MNIWKRTKGKWRGRAKKRKRMGDKRTNVKTIVSSPYILAKSRIAKEKGFANSPMRWIIIKKRAPKRARGIK